MEVDKEIERDKYAFSRAADWYIDHVGLVEPGLDHRNRRVILRRLYDLAGCKNTRSLGAAYRRLEEKVRKVA